MPLETAQLLPLVRGVSPLGLHLVPGPASLGGAFLPLANPDGVPVYVAVVKGDADTVLDLCALKLLPADLREAFGAREERLTTPEMERRFAAERERLASLRSVGPYFPRLVGLEPLAGATPGTLPPLFYCRPTRRFFVPPCPRCLAPLTTCRDDRLLAAKRLPVFTSTLERFLYCATCATTDASAFYSIRPPLVPGGTTVGNALDLVDALAHALLTEPPRVLEAFPSPECVAEAVALKAAGADAPAAFRERWLPFSFYDAPYVLTGLAPLDLDEVADLLGGRPWEDLTPAGPSSSLEAASAQLRHRWVEASGDLQRRFLLASDGSGLDAAEVLALKISLFRQVAEAALHFQRATGQAHLDLHPKRVQLDLYAPGNGLPAYWNFVARVDGVTASGNLPLPGGGSMVVPPLQPPVPYAAPELVEFHLAGQRPVDLVFSELEELGGGRYRLIGRLYDTYGIFPTPKEADWVVLTLQDEALGLGLTTVPARRRLRTRDTAQEIQFITEPLEIDETPLRRIKLAFGVRVPGARYRIYPDFSTPTDLYALGLILLRLLVVNDAQQIGALAEGLRAFERNGTPPATLAALSSDSPDLAARLTKSQLFYRALDRTPDRPNAVPDGLWERAVFLALRLGTRWPGFSFAVDAGDVDPRHRTGRLDETVAEARRLETDLHALLFQRQSLHLEIQQVLGEVLLEELAAG